MATRHLLMWLFAARGGRRGVIAIAPVIFEIENCESKLDTVAMVAASCNLCVLARVGKVVLVLCVCERE